MKKDWKRKEILKASHLPNFSNLNKIKRLWNYLKNYFDKYSINTLIWSKVDLAKNFIC